MKLTESINSATIRIFWQTSLQNRRDLLLSMLQPLGVIALGVVVPLLVGKMLAALGNGLVNPSIYIPYFIAAAVVGILCNRYGFKALMQYQAKTMGQLQIIALQGLLRRSTGFHNNNVGGKLVSDALDYPQAFALLANAAIINLIPFAVLLLVGSIVVFVESWMLGTITLLTAVYALGSGIWESRQRSPIRARRLKVMKKMTGHLADSIVNVQTVKTFAREDSELTRHTELNHNLRDMRVKDWAGAALAGNRRIAVLLLIQLLFIVLAIMLVQRDPSLLGIGIFAFSFSVTINNRLFEINSFMRNIEDGLLMASPMTEILQEDPEIKDAPGATDLKVTEGAIALQNIHFKYRENEGGQAVFSNLDLLIKPGEKIGLVGPSGGGKSTLTRLLLRFDDVSDGAIAIDGQNISEVTQASLRQAVSYVPQEPLLFHRSVQENIAYGRPNATLKEVKKAAKLAHADEFIDRLSDGYNTIVGERGVKLSGGQRQRVAIARAILKDAPILVLDEATSALDSESEVHIQDALWKLMEKRTAIVIAHRLSTIQKMDRILVLDNGKIIEQGTHKELLAGKGLYAKLWSHQSGGFLEE